MDLAHANEMLPQPTLHGLGQHRMPVALLGPRAIATRAQRIAQPVEELGCWAGGRPLPETAATGKMARKDCCGDAEAGAERGRDRRRIGTDERATPLV